MPADIETLVYVKEEGVPWHGLGTGTDGYKTSTELMNDYGYNWEVKKAPVLFEAKPTYNYSHVVAKVIHDVPTRNVLYRSTDQQPLGIVGDGYQADSPRKIFSMADELIPDGIARWNTVGTLWNASWPIFFASMKLEKDWLIRGEKHNQYLLFHTDYNGKYSLQILGTDVRVVCRNTANLALSKDQDEGARIRHNAVNRDQVIAEALQEVEIINDKMRRFNDWAETYDISQRQDNIHSSALRDTTLGFITPHQQLSSIFRIISPLAGHAVVGNPDPKNLRKLRQIAITRNKFVHDFLEPEIKRNGDTLFSLYNAAIGYADYGKNTRSSGKSTIQQARTKSLLLGSAKQMKDEIHRVLIEA
jgi:phage/plasmid-like protein (TIGR03299 family)